jgi:CRP/FNR family transcriptional regulator, cyclic AMP receptor protein
MQVHDMIQLLGQTALLGGLSRPVLERIAALLKPHAFGARALLFARGEAGTSLHLIVKGTVRLSVVTDEGRELAFRQARAGDIIGEIAALDGGVRSADATAISAVDVLSLSRADLLALMRSEAELQARVVTFLCQRLRETSDQLEMIALFPIETRLARLLLVFLGKENADSAGYSLLSLGLSQGEMALMLGATRPKVNGALSDLEKKGVLKRQGELLLCHRQRLMGAAREADFS